MNTANPQQPANGGSGHRGRFLKRATAAAVTVAILGTVAATAPHLAASAASTPSQAVTDVRGNPALPGFADLVSQVRSAVVNVSVTPARADHPAAEFMRERPSAPTPEAFRHFFERYGFPVPTPQPRQAAPSVGSGFLVDQEGWIVTNHHVVDGNGHITVTLQDGREFPAKLQGSDAKTDIALLKIEAGEPLPALAFGNSDKTRVGDWVLAVGNPFGLGGSVSAGIVSARGRDIGSGPFDDFIQVDAPINRGNSGGPLFNASGEVIGINTAIFSPSGGNVGIGFAIPANLAAPLIEDLRDDGVIQRGWLGVQIQPVSAELASGLGLSAASGALVAQVFPDTPASRMGLEAGDVIVGFGSQDIETVRDLTRTVAAAKAGSSQKVRVFRDGRERTLTANVAAYPREASAGARVDSESSPPTGPRLGLRIAPTEPGADHEGLEVADVEPGGIAARHGLRPGDILLKAGTERLSEAQTLRSAVQAAAATKRPLIVLVQRGNAVRFVALDVAKS